MNCCFFPFLKCIYFFNVNNLKKYNPFILYIFNLRIYNRYLYNIDKAVLSVLNKNIFFFDTLYKYYRGHQLKHNDLTLTIYKLNHR